MNIIHDIIGILAEWVISVINATGEAGVFMLMALESANIPIPSEIIMPFAGFAASRGIMGFWIVVFAGALGNFAGSALSYWIGLRGGRPFVERYGKYFLVRVKDLDRGDEYFKRYGAHVAFWSRLLPIVRTFISLPAGINRSPFVPFAVFTFIGSFIWSAILAAIGFWLGEQWHAVGPYFERAQTGIGILIIIAAAWWVWRHIRRIDAKEEHF